MAEFQQKLKGVPMSREGFEKLPEGLTFYDYIDGKAIEVNGTNGRHRRIAGRLRNALAGYPYGHKLLAVSLTLTCFHLQAPLSDQTFPSRSLKTLKDTMRKGET